MGAGIAGMQVALDIAGAGHEVVVVERLPSIGGRMAQLAETFPTLDCAQCILTPRTVDVGHHEKIRLITYAEVEAIEGEVGDFRARIRRRRTYVDWDACTGCGLCQEKCPTRVTSEFERGVGERKAIYTLSPQAVPNRPVIDAEHCLWIQRGKCGACQKLCPVGAIDFEQEEETIEVACSAVVLAPGYALYGLENLPEYGGGTVPDVIDTLAFERVLSSSGPTTGKIRRPSDGREPQEVVFIQCAGSRDPQKHLSYCSKVCCMVVAKQATLYRHRVHGGQAYVFYIDIRAGGKGYDEFTQRAMEDENVVYMRGKVSRLFRDGDRVVVCGADTLSNQQVKIAADLVVVAPALRPHADTARLARTLGLPTDKDGWLVPVDGKVRPLETEREGIFLAGAATGPADIAETVAQASGAAAHALIVLSR